MKSQYISSVVIKYGDIEKVKQDAKTIRDIESRQGSSLLIDCLAESCGETAIKFNFSSTDRKNLIKNLLSELENALRKRL